MTVTWQEATYGRPFDITLETAALHTLIVLHGELDISGIGRLRTAFDGPLRTGRPHVVVDLTDLDFVDAAGLGLLAETAAALRSAGGALTLRGVSERHRRLLVITGLEADLPEE